MKIVLATPFYPPDIGHTANYTKDLALRLKDDFELEIITYGRIPEKIDGVKITCVNGLLPITLRVVIFLYKIMVASIGSKLILAQNGASVELPAAIASKIMRVPLVACISDTQADRASISKGFIYKTINKIFIHSAMKVLKETPNQKPEILPFKNYPEKEMTDYEASWSKHLLTLRTIFHGN